MAARAQRRISSLSVTYQEEFHRPRPRELATSNGRFAPRPLLLKRHGDQSLEDMLLCDQAEPGGGGADRDSQDDSFYSSSSMAMSKPQPLHPAPSNVFRLPAPVQQPSKQLECSLPPLLPPPLPLPPPSGQSLLHRGVQSEAGVHCCCCCHRHWDLDPAALHSLEDALRLRINREIEDFRASIQQVMSEQFTGHRVQNCNQHYQPTTQPQTNESLVMEEDSALVPGTQSSQESLTCGTDHCTEPEYSYYGNEPCGYQKEYSPDGSSYSNDASNGTVDSGLGGEGQEELRHQQHSEEEEEEAEINACLIQLLTSASILTNALQRAEYAVT